jgi:hypothetical protein
MVESALMTRLIVEWLTKQGYHSSALSLYNSSVGQADILNQTGKSFQDIPGSSDMDFRKSMQNVHLEIHDLICIGSIGEALDHLTLKYPTIFKRFPSANAQMQCLRFIELFQDCNSHMDTSESDWMSNLIEIAQKIESMFKNGHSEYLEAIQVYTR